MARRLGAAGTVAAIAIASACAEGTTIDGAGGAGAGAATSSETSTRDATGTATGMPTSSTGVSAQCPPDQFATGFAGDGTIQCAAIDAAAQAAVAASCAVYLGWRDSCGGCTTAPAKWGRAQTGACTDGLGSNGTCTTAALGGATVHLYGLNTDGDVNDDDKFYATFHCAAGDATAQPGPCDAGEFVTGVDGGDVTCTPASGAVLDFVRQGCSLYLGWRDSCDGCATPPDRWGRASSTACESGSGAQNTCISTPLGGETVQLFGLATGGDVNDDDKFYVGLRCEPPQPAEGPARGTCPAGQLLTAVEVDGGLACASPAPLVHAWFQASCNAYLGWIDSCDACGTIPAKWGRASDGACESGLGAGGTCTAAMLGGETVNLFGLNTDGEVNDDDKFHVGFACQ